MRAQSNREKVKKEKGRAGQGINKDTINSSLVIDFGPFLVANNKTTQGTAFARSLSYSNRSIKTKVQHSIKTALLTQIKRHIIEIISSSRKLMNIDHDKLELSFLNALQAVVMLIPWTAWSGLCV